MAIKINYLADYPEAALPLQTWFKEQWGFAYPNRTLIEWQEELYFNKNKLPLTLIASCDSDANFNIVGCGSLCLKTDFIENGRSTWLERIFVLPTMRGKGIASQLILNFIEISKTIFIENEPISEIKLLTRDAKGIYLRHGWEEVKVINYQGGPVSFMVKKL